ncbi:hypothetical protein EG68_03411 [Paragonimus skrjabini miyazakii]|uniref:Dihydroorotate dehydrogenase (quinone), mitochondrial n=1 Tax=Paragonimus skrjabini miyazakii TaxID=59628 RepID=A0A8S9Z1U0_9TREM|nr:hypothetical protein EG68_03411 [Paragonimus skrjabini miyazakii]
MTSRLKSTATILGLGLGIFTAEAMYSGNERFYREVVMPALHLLVPDGEKAHMLAVRALHYGLGPQKPRDAFQGLQRTVFGLKFAHPVGVAAGFDKDGEAVMGLLKAGFSHVEVGTVTPHPQPGNSRPRVFRWKEQEAVINRYGFNSQGHEAVYDRLKDRPWEGRGIVGVNLGCNKTSPDPIADFVAGVTKFGNVADYLVINVSSPNTPGLRSWQNKERLRELLSSVLKARSQLNKRTPILLKISPDESDQCLKEIVEVAMNPATRVDGLIVSNTTLVSHAEAAACGAAPINLDVAPSDAVWGGLSGRPLREKSTACLARVSVLTRGQLPLIGVGGISSAQDAVEKLRAGASLVQLYTSMIYQGPPVVSRVARGLDELREPTVKA